MVKTKYTMKIGFYGATGSWDFGDYAMMVHNIQEILSISEDSEFFVFTPDKYVTLQVFVNNLMDLKQIRKIHIVDGPQCQIKFSIVERIAIKMHWLDYGSLCLKKVSKIYKSFCKGDWSLLSDEFKRVIEQVDIMLFNGGGYLQYNWSIRNYHFSIAVKYAHVCGKPVYFLGNSIGPMKEFDWVIRDMIHDVDGIMIRDGMNYTKRLLDSYGYKKYVNGPDDLTFVNDIYKSVPMLNNYVIIEIASLIGHAQKGSQFVLSEFLGLIDYLTETGKNVALVTLDKNDNHSFDYIDYLYDNARHKGKVIKFKEIGSIYEVFALYAHCDFSVSTKYHPVVLALGSNKPFIGIICGDDGYYEGKLKGACDNLSVPYNNHIIYVDSVKDGTLINFYEENVDKKVVDNMELDRLKNIRNVFLRKVLSFN